MLNKQQRKFLQDMKDIEREKQRRGQEEPLSYRFERSGLRPHKYRNPLFAGVGGVVLTTAIVLWRVFAAYTWIRPITPMIQTADASLNLTNVHTFEQTTSKVPSSAYSDQHVVHDYIQLTDAAWRTLDALITPLLNTDTLNSLPSKTFAEDGTSLTNMQRSYETTVSVLLPLEELNQRQIKLVQTVVTYAELCKSYPNGSDWRKVRQLVEQYNSNWQSERNIVISILNTEHMPYQINADGSLSYRYNP